MAKGGRNEKSWERQENESARAYEAFDLYCKMGANRSLRRVAQELGKSNTLITRWNSKWSWQKRCRDYDMDLRREEFAVAKKEYAKMQERHIKTAAVVQKKAVEALTNMDISSLSAADILRFIIEGAKMEEKAMREVTVEKAGNAGADNQTASLADTIVRAYQERMERSEND